jgi:hypothetical protein
LRASFERLLAVWVAPAALAAPPFGIEVVDRATGRGVPLVELRTVSGLSWWTDNAGWVAIDEPALLGRPVYFHVQSPGYAHARDGFGNAGFVATPEPGETRRVEIDRVLRAQRLARLTGEGLYRDSVKLGRAVPLREPLLNAQVVGQDSVQTAAYRDRRHWFWGDTQRQRYPLGLFATAGAVTPLRPEPGAVDYQYFTREDGFARAMFPLDQPGVVWIDGVCVAADAEGRERLFCHFSHRKGLTEQIRHGIGVWNDATERFEIARELPKEEVWRHPLGQAMTFQEDGQTFLGFANPFVHVRVPAQAEALLDPSRYEAFTWVKEADVWVARWQGREPPLTQAREGELLRAEAIAPAAARVSPVSATTGKPVRLHAGSVATNAHRRAWIMIANEHFGDSVLGEVHLLEAPAATGPWHRAEKVATHGGFDFYNPVHHPFWDEDGGRVIHFEGTFTETFSGLKHRVPLYEYNQLLYRLELE